ncbi:MAG: carbohydrate ABC transporter permease [Chloroflexi bacterium]|nr:carbohydrate ABC transporter permease [Chloroflexota bacterium]
MKQERGLIFRLFAILITAIFTLPLYLAVVNVFKTLEQIRYRPIALPAPFIWDNLITVINRPDNLLFEGLKYSLLITASTVILLVFFASTIGFYIARSDSRLSRFLLFLFVAGMLIPPQVTLIPVTRLLKFMGLMGSFQGLVLYLAGSGMLSFAVFVYAGFVKSIPRELDESAMIEGASRFTLFWRIIFPLMRPATATVVIFLSLWTWNEFLLPLIIVGPSQGITITTGIYTAVGTYTSDYGQIFSLMFLSALPMLAFFFLLQKEFIAGLTAGSLKG